MNILFTTSRLLWWAKAPRVTLRVSAYTLYKHSDRFSSLLLPRNLSVALVGSSGLEPPTSCLSGMRSNLLSYEPVDYFRCVLLSFSRATWWR